ncbi:MAG TPA: hypothetical protein VI636_14865 [Candidatus Angelobacter sp.]
MSSITPNTEAMNTLSYSRAMDQHTGAVKGPPAIGLSPLVGSWINFDRNTRGIIRIVLTGDDQKLRVHAFGACSPESCDWGTVPAAAFAESASASEAVGFRAFYNFGFLGTMLAAYLNKRLLVIDAYNQFKDGSGRSEYFLRDHFYLED